MDRLRDHGLKQTQRVVIRARLFERLITQIAGSAVWFVNGYPLDGVIHLSKNRALRRLKVKKPSGSSGWSIFTAPPLNVPGQDSKPGALDQEWSALTMIFLVSKCFLLLMFHVV